MFSFKKIKIFLTHNALVAKYRIKYELKRKNKIKIYQYLNDNLKSFCDTSKFKHNTLLIQTYPRSGTNYTCDLLNKVLNIYPLLNKYPDIYDELNKFELKPANSLFWSSGSREETIDFNKTYANNKLKKIDVYIYYKNMFFSALGEKKVVKLHYYHKTPRGYAVAFIVRYPFDVIKSHFLTHKQRDVTLQLNDGLLKKHVNDWKKSLKQFEDYLEKNEKVVLLRYEDYFYNFEGNLQKILNLIGADYDHSLTNTLCPNEKMKSKHSYWTDDLTFYSKAQVEYIKLQLRDEINKYWPEKVESLNLEQN